jgi:hypothetical protein
MRKDQVLTTPRGRVLLADSITLITADDAGAVVVSGSHGGSSSAAFALEQPLALVVFNDAGIGKREAGVVGLEILQAQGVPALAVAHTSACIGDAQDAWLHGTVSRANAAAQALGLQAGEGLRGAIERWLAGDVPHGEASR